MTDLIGNHVSLGCITLSAAIEHVRTGTLVPLALIAAERAPALRELPTTVELGHPDIGGAIWSWLAGPKNFQRPWSSSSTGRSAARCRGRRSGNG